MPYYANTGADHIRHVLQLEAAYHMRRLAEDLPPHFGEPLLVVARRVKTGVYNSDEAAAAMARIIGNDRPHPDTESGLHIDAAQAALAALHALGR